MAAPVMPAKSRDIRGIPPAAAVTVAVPVAVAAVGGPVVDVAARLGTTFHRAQADLTAPVAVVPLVAVAAVGDPLVDMAALFQIGRAHV